MDKPKRHPRTDLSQVRPSYLYHDEKAKPKRRQQSWLHRWTFGKQFAFYSPYTLEECVYLLSSYAETIVRKDDDHYTFSLCFYRYSRNTRRTATAETIGTLTRDGDETRVEGRSRVHLLLRGTMTVWLVFWSSIWLGFEAAPIAIFGVVYAAVTFANFDRVAVRGRRRVIELLSKQK